MEYWFLYQSIRNQIFLERIKYFQKDFFRNERVILSIFRNFAWMFWGNTIYSLCQWALVVFLAKFGNVEMVGKYSLALAITAPIFMFTNLQLRAVQIADVRNEFKFNTYFSLRVYSSLLGVFISLGILLLCNYQWETRLTIFIIGVAKGIESVSDIFWGLQQKNERMDFVAKSMLLRGVISVIGFTSAIYVTGSIVVGSLALTLSWGLVLLFYDISNMKLTGKEPTNEKIFAISRGEYQIDPIMKLIRKTLPLGAALALVSLNANIPRYFVEYYLGEGSLGIFSALLYLMIPGSLILNSMGQSISPQMAKMVYENNFSRYRHYLINIVVVGGMISLIALFLSLIWGKEILLAFYTWEYAQQDKLLLWIMGAAFLIYLSTGLGYGMTAAGYFKPQTPLFAGITILTMITNYIFVPRLGIFGAVISLLISGFAQLLGSVWILRNIICHGQTKPLNRRNRIKVIHVLGKMDRGGAETWLMHVLRNINREKYQIDFVVHTNDPGDYDDEIIHLGSKIIPCLSPYHPWKYYNNLISIFREYGPYDVIHSHVHHFSGYILKIAKGVNIPVRIAHSHNDTSSLQKKASIKRRLYLLLMKRWIDRYSTLGLAASKKAAYALFGCHWNLKPWIRIHYCGIDLVPFREKYDSKEVRNELGIDENVFCHWPYWQV